MHLFRQAVQVAVILENTIVGIFQYAVIRTVSQSAARLLQGRAPHQNYMKLYNVWFRTFLNIQDTRLNL